MTDPGKKKLRRATIVYWVLLFYIVAALVWWFISLEKQNDAMTKLQVNQLNATVDSGTQPVLYQQELTKILKENKRNTGKYVSEGVTFFLLILVGAGFVYRSVRRQLRLQQQHQNFIMAVTHELKTPISVTHLNLETLQKYSLEPEKQKKLIRMTLQETSRLNDLTNNILISSQLDGEGYKSSKEELDISDLLKDRVHDFRMRYPERNFKENIESEIELKGDPLLLQMLINNLVENAIKYSPKQKPITCVLRQHNRHIELSIIDEGPGIEENEKQRIFDKFYRIGNELTRKTQGTGLGLYLCRKIAKDHNADIRVTNNEPGGSNFTVMFTT